MTNSTDIMGYTADADLYCPECAALTYDRYVQGIGPCTIANGKALDREGNSVVPAFADDFVGLWLCARCHGEIDFGGVDRCPACGDRFDGELSA